MKTIKIFKGVFATPGDIKCNTFYSIFITLVLLFCINEQGINKFISGLTMAFIVSSSIYLNIGSILKYINENGSISGFRKKTGISLFFSYIWMTVLTLLLSFAYFSCAPYISLGTIIGLVVGIIVPTIGATIMFKALPWNLKAE